jgi:class 3 adenylate cyclase
LIRAENRRSKIGERRHVTVMFCDLVDSTGIAARLDAEEWRDLVGAYVEAASTAVTEMGGKVAKKLGDGLMALFGHPIAQENDAERAARAALAIQRALAELNRKNASSSQPSPLASPSIRDRWWSMHRAKYSDCAAKVRSLWRVLALVYLEDPPTRRLR